MCPSQRYPTDTSNTDMDAVVDYGDFFLGAQVLSMSRLGGAAAVAPLVADMASEVVITGLHSSSSSPIPVVFFFYL